MPVDDSYTKSLLHFNGADGSTTFTDESGKTWTASGNAVISTLRPKFTAVSGYFDGNGDFLFHPGSTPDSDFAFGTGDFTIDFWFNTLLVDGTYKYLYSSADGTTTTCPTIFQKTDGAIIYGKGQGDVRITSTTKMTDTWHHIAVVRYSGNTKLYIDGTQEGSTFADSTNYTVGAARPVLMGDNVAANNAKGCLKELRVSKGIARWTGNFTPQPIQYGSSGQVIIWSS